MPADDVTIAFTPHGRLVPDPLAGPPSALGAAFVADDATALLELAARRPHEPLPEALGWFRDLARALVAGAAAAANGAAPPASRDDLANRVVGAPPFTGREYLDADAAVTLWQRLAAALAAQTGGGTLEAWLAARNPSWSVVGRVCFHLAENRADAARPFAFLATYTTGLADAVRAQHRPLGQAVAESAANGDRAGLLKLLVPVQRAAERSAVVKGLVDSQAVFRPQAWTPAQAYALLREIPAIEESGVSVRIPDWWRGNRPRVRVEVRLDAPGAGLGSSALLGFQIGLALDGEPLDEAERLDLRAAVDGLVVIRGRWVEVDRQRLDHAMSAWQAAAAAAADGVSFHKAMRLLNGVEGPGSIREEGPADPGWSRVIAGPTLARTLDALRAPGADVPLPGATLRATLRPYQEVGVRWLVLANELGLGVCLADDMGLGKTIQVLSLLLVLDRRGPRRHLLVAPASLLGNWIHEAARFAPSLRVVVAHASGDGVDPDVAKEASLVITTYGTLARTPWLEAGPWDTVVLDEAQAIKNPGAQQTRVAKAVRARVRVALTGTPVENRAGDLWSLFDFLQPGLLGSAAEFKRLAAQATSRPDGWAPLRRLVAPYVLRRLKTDPDVAPDLPAKTEIVATCGLTKEQAALYQQAVDDLAQRLRTTDGIARRGAVLQSLMRLKQICNHPSHWLGDGGWQVERSAKLGRVAELVEPIVSRQEKVLVFTQFREAVDPLARALAAWFGRPGLVLHGEVAIGKRQELVKRFQEDDAVPFFVLSLKAGGTGLTLTAATHVVHFDRWWNPAVEDQATDRAFRIGQKKPVFVHKLVCRGTMEERVDALIHDKRRLARDLLGQGGDEVRLTEMSDAEILATVALDLSRAALDG